MKNKKSETTPAVHKEKEMMVMAVEAAKKKKNGRVLRAKSQMSEKRAVVLLHAEKAFGKDRSEQKVVVNSFRYFCFWI
ncbi:hypothetical protein S83_026807 [Arachis hypogaea]